MRSARKMSTPRGVSPFNYPQFEAIARSGTVALGAGPPHSLTHWHSEEDEVRRATCSRLARISKQDERGRLLLNLMQSSAAQAVPVNPA